MARVAIVIPAYNYRAYLPEAISSLKRQSLQDWECVVVDDGSTDGTLAVAHDLAANDLRITLVPGAHRGPSAARNVGVALTSAPYLQFLDADDLLEPDKLRNQAEYLDCHEEVDVVFGDVRLFEVGTDLSRLADLGAGPSGRGERAVAALADRNGIAINAALVRRSAIERVRGFSEDLVHLEDWDLWMRLAVSGASFARNAPVDSAALVRLHGGSLTTDHRGMLVARVDVRNRFARMPSVGGRAGQTNAWHLGRATAKLALVDLRQRRLAAALRSLMSAMYWLIHGVPALRR